MGVGGLFATLALGSVAAIGMSAYDDVPMSILSGTSSDSGRTHSSGTRARRQWKRRRAPGITKRVRS